MSKQSLLLVDGDTRSLRVLEVSLRKAGFTVTPAASVADALEKLEVHTPDLIISETKFPTDLDGFELRRRVRGTPASAEIPFVFLTAETAIEHKIRGLELGVDDYLTKPIYIKEIVTRINILLQKRQRLHFDERKDGVRFAGRVADMPVVDVIQTIEVSRKSGVIQFIADRQRTAAIYFRDGKVIDAEAGTLQGEDAVYRLLTWSEGEFEVVFRTVRRREVIASSSQGLLMEGMRRLDEWSHLLEQLPPLSHRFEIDTAELAARLGEVPDDNNLILRLVDGKRSLLEVIDGSDFGDLECLQAISRLYFEGLLVDLDPQERPKRDTGKPMPLVMMENSPTPIEEVASGPIPHGRGGEVIAEGVTSDAIVGDPALLAISSAVNATPVPAAAMATQPVAEENIEEALDPLADLDDPEPGPLMGGYRQSSLRLIDEAVAAAQAIDPSLFDDEASGEQAPVPAAAVVASARTSTSTSTDANESQALQLGDFFADGELDDAAAVASTVVAPIARVQLAVRESDPRIANARGLVERKVDEPANGYPRARTVPPPPPGAENAKAAADASDGEDSGVPTEIESDAESSSGRGPPAPPPGRGRAISDSEQPAVVVSADTSAGLRMIGSHGHDRAEASGELRPLALKPSAPNQPREAEREMVTILPRRITREVPIVAPPADVDANGAPISTPPGAANGAANGAATGAAAGASDPPADDAASAAESESNIDASAASIPSATPLPKSLPHAPFAPPAPPALPDIPRRAIDDGGRGPGLGVMAAVALVSLLAGMSVFLLLRKKTPSTATSDAAVSQVIDAPLAQSAPPPVPPDVALAQELPADAAAPLAAVPIDASAVATPPTDAGASVAVAPTTLPRAPTDAGTGAPDPMRDARALLEQAHSALEEGDPARAEQLARSSLKLHHTARAYLELARALHRLDRVDDALAAVDAAIALVKDYAPAWEQRGMILWAARRTDEARPALEKYLELDPHGRDAPAVRQMLGLP